MTHPRPWTSKRTNAGIGLYDANGDTICHEWDIDQESCDHIVACVNACAGTDDPEAEIKRLRKYDGTPECHHGHVSLPLHLWDCPTCTEIIRNDKAKLLQWLGVLLDQVDYTSGACTFTEMVGAVLPKDVIEKARAAITKAHP